MNNEDAREWLESLQQVGEGWYRQVALAIKMGAHKALGMERREFAQAIGQKMIDPRQAIIELHKEGHSIRAIADVLGVHRETAHHILAEEGLVERRALVAQNVPVPPEGVVQNVPPGPEEADTEADELRAEVEALQAKVQAEREKAKAEREKAKRTARHHDEVVKDLQRMLLDEKERRAEAEENDPERKRKVKEGEAAIEEQARKMLSGLSFIQVDDIVLSLERAAERVRVLITEAAITSEAIERIEAAHAGFQEELNVARMAATTTRGDQ